MVRAANRATTAHEDKIPSHDDQLQNCQCV